MSRGLIARFTDRRQRTGRAEHEVVLHDVGIRVDNFDELPRRHIQFRLVELHLARDDAEAHDDIGRLGATAGSAAPADPAAPPSAVNATCAASCPGLV